MKRNLFTPWPPSHSDLSWLAGLLDGEGSFFRGKNSGLARIECQMTDEDVIARAAKLTGVGYGRREVKPGRKTLFRLALSGPRAEFVMRELAPMMGTRRQQQIREALKE